MTSITDLLNNNFWQQIINQNSNPWHLLMSIFDIAIVAYIIYRLTRFVQGTRLMILVRGVFLFIVIDLLAVFLDLSTLKWLLNQVITYGVIALIIVFQPEIRQALERLGYSTNLIPWIKPKNSASNQIEAYERSFEYMSMRKIGALVAIERSQTLKEYASSGIKLDADISSSLLINIFIPNTPLHDGAVIIENNKISVASAYLPLSERSDISKEYGTRHRAAIGLADVSDALVLIASEETGGISVAHRGNFYSDISKEQFHQILTDELNNSPEERQTRLSSWFKKRGKGDNR
ncbi:diadenylate cyclase CdaA [Lactovum miscens]|uniref:Diadenylate cyclase n=1 Tax=Lactovum miscens TaxID=190387 RepID=A0A841C6R3_9LACT|nr:diadenylate cyclase CdaA [Lactovum miscens]MBB5888034.1 diadenylate cyclase [Lactovum miscens]